MEQIITQYGLPVSIYCDRHTIFISPKDGKLSIEEQLQGKQENLTQFGRAMEELGINVIPANSPQAKGRIERLWETLQSRLPVEFKIAGINTMEAANAFLSQFMERHNNRFAVQPENPVGCFLQNRIGQSCNKNSPLLQVAFPKIARGSLRNIYP